jgi:hypothetical protein
MEPEIIPTKDEINRGILEVIKHTCHAEYFFTKLNAGHNDPERPHDLVGPGNKLEWSVIKGFSLQYRVPKVDFKTYILPALEVHRQQYHHQKWNNPDPADETKPFPGATKEDMLVGAIDAVCSLLENRAYQGGIHDYDKVIEVAKKNPPHKTPYMLEVIPIMKKLIQPKLELITELNSFPNIGLEENTYKKIQERIIETINMLGGKGYEV